MLAHRLRRWPNIVFAGESYLLAYHYRSSLLLFLQWTRKIGLSPNIVVSQDFSQYWSYELYACRGTMTDQVFFYLYSRPKQNRGVNPWIFKLCNWNFYTIEDTSGTFRPSVADQCFLYLESKPKNESQPKIAKLFHWNFHTIEAMCGTLLRCACLQATTLKQASIEQGYF